MGRNTDAGALTAQELYELTVQAPRVSAELLRDVHGASPRVLGEDFAGSGALSRAWVELVPDGRAFAVDRDARNLARAVHPRVEAHVLDVRSPEVRRLGPCDVVHAGNFSLGELHERAELVGWARASHSRLARGGIVAADTYGGESAWRVGSLERRRVLEDGREIRWVWDQRSADPRTAEVVNALSFRVLRAGVVVSEMPDAFVYRWRLWSVPELVDVLCEVGFVDVTVRTCLDGERESDSEEVRLHSSCVALVVGR